MDQGRSRIGRFDEDVEAIDPQFLEHNAGDPEAWLRLIRTTGKRIVGEHADALKRLAEHDPDENV